MMLITIMRYTRTLTVINFQTLLGCHKNKKKKRKKVKEIAKVSISGGVCIKYMNVIIKDSLIIGAATL